MALHLAPPESLQKLAKRIWALERKVNVLSTQPQLGTSGFSGTIVEYDENGNIVSQTGLQADGTHGAVTLGGPTPPTPSTPILTPIKDGLLVEWDGTFTDSPVALLDFARVSVYVDEAAGFTATSAELRATVESPQGGGALVAPLDIVPQYVKFICWSTAGKPSAPSAEASAVPLAEWFPAKDVFFVVSPSKRKYRLTKLPIDQSVNFSLNGLELTEGDEYTVDLAAADLTLAAGVQTVAGADHDILTADYWTAGVAAIPEPVIFAADDFERPNSATVINPSSDGGNWIIDHDSGLTDAQWGVLNGGGYMVSTGSNSLGNGSTLDRDVGSLAQDVTWVLTNTTGPYDFSSRMRLCSMGITPGHGTPKSLELGYNTQHTGWSIGVVDWGGYTPLVAGGGLVVENSWEGGGTTTFRMVYLPSTHELTIWQDGVVLYTGVLTFAEYDGLGTGAGVRFRRPYGLFGERLLDFQAVGSE